MSKVILLSGASSRLGSALAGYLVERGHIVYGGYRNGKVAESTNLIPIRLDIASEIECRKVVAQIYKQHNKLDVLINCVGITKSGKVEEMNLSEFDDLIEVNVKGALRLTKLVLPVMERQKYGKIINISSLSGLIAFPNYGYYSASKFAVEGLFQALRYEVHKDNIQVVNVEPGAITFNQNKKVVGNGKSVRERYPIVGILLPLVFANEVAVKIEKIINDKNSPANVLIGRDTKLTYFAKKYLPAFVWDEVIKFFWK